MRWHLVDLMSKYVLFGTNLEQENELINILIDSSLYRDLYLEDKRKLLHYLVFFCFIGFWGLSRGKLLRIGDKIGTKLRMEFVMGCEQNDLFVIIPDIDKVILSYDLTLFQARQIEIAQDNK